jgi:hypothetical protein
MESLAQVILESQSGRNHEKNWHAVFERFYPYLVCMFEARRIPKEDYRDLAQERLPFVLLRGLIPFTPTRIDWLTTSLQADLRFDSLDTEGYLARHHKQTSVQSLRKQILNCLAVRAR